MLITNWKEMMWVEWAHATETLLRARGDDEWSRLWNETLDRRIDDVLRMYGVDHINLDSLNKELVKDAVPESQGTNDLHRMQATEDAGTVDLRSLPYRATEEGETAWSRGVRAVLGSLLRSDRDGSAPSEQGR